MYILDVKATFQQEAPWVATGMKTTMRASNDRGRPNCKRKPGTNTQIINAFEIAITGIGEKIMDTMVDISIL